MLLKEHTASTHIDFITEVSKFAEVMECLQMTGSHDFILRTVTRDMDAHHEFLRNKLATLPNIATVKSYFVFWNLRAGPLIRYSDVWNRGFNEGDSINIPAILEMVHGPVKATSGIPLIITPSIYMARHCLCSIEDV